MRLLQDARFALRLVVKGPGFAAVAVITIALGIGVNTTLFSAAHLALHDRTAGMARPEDLVLISAQLEAKKGQVGNGIGYAPFADYDEYRQATEVFDLAVARQYPVKMVWEANTALADVQVVTGNYFDVIGVSPFLGRGFRTDETEGRGAPVTIVSYDSWQRHLDGDANVLGRTVKLNGQPFTIVGVNPKNFPSPGFSVPTASYDHLFPADTGALVERGRAYCEFTGRLKPGITIEQAQARVAAIAVHLAEEYPATDQGTTARVAALMSGDPEQRRARLFAVGAFLALGTLVLLVACANVCNLLFARAQARQREMAIRSALGAGRMRLVRQLLTESFLLAALGGLLGLVFAHWAQALIEVWLWPDLDLHSQPHLVIDGRAVAYTGLLLLVSTVAFGLLPALRLSSLDLMSALKGKSADGGRGRRLSAGLVTAQIATAFVLLIISGLLVRSLRAAQSAELGFDPTHLLTARMDLSFESYPKSSWPALFHEIQQKLAALPGATGASLAQGLPLINRIVTLYSVQGEDAAGARQQCWFTNVDAEYLRTLRIPLLEGRDIRRTDDPDRPRVALVNKSFAEHFWPGRSALGHVLTMDATNGKPVEVVGVFADTKFGPFTDPSARVVFLSLYQADQANLNLIVRTSQDPTLLAGRLRETIKTINPDMLLLDVTSYEETLMRNTFFIFRVSAVFAGALASLALVLAVVGLYGLLAFSVSQKTHEVGVRMALGADSRHVIWLFVRRGLILTAAGLAVGFVVSLALKRLITTYLYGISAVDPATFLTVPLLFGAVALLASFLPARRATRIDPMEALRSE